MLPRREFLGGVTVVLGNVGAGCIFPDGETNLNAEPVDSDDDIVEKATTTISSSFEIEKPTTTGSYEFNEIISGGISADDPVSSLDRYPAVFENTVYDVEIWINNREGYAAEFTPVQEDFQGEAVQFAALPAVDREAFGVHRWRFDESERTTESLEGLVVYEETAGSELVPEQTIEAVTIDGVQYSVELSSTTLDKLTYIGTKRAPSPQAFAQEIRSEWLFELAGLSEDEQQILEEAIDDQYFTGDDNETFASLMERFAEHNPLVNNYLWFFDWQGSTYWARTETLSSYPEIDSKIDLEPDRLRRET